MHEGLLYLLAIFAGLLAGFINTLAGSGSLVSLPMLMALGLPAPIANGTNRVGVLFQSIVGIWKFHKTGNLPVQNGKFLILPTLLGSMVGAFVAIDLNEEMMRRAIAVVMAVMLVVILLNPKQWLREASDPDIPVNTPRNFVIFFLIGAYGGFIQAGVGIFLLAGMVMSCGFSMIHANGIKLVMVGLLTIPAAAIFAFNDCIHLGYGLLMAVGQSGGAWLAGHFAANSARAGVWIRRLLMTIIVLSILKLSGLADLLWQTLVVG